MIYEVLIAEDDPMVAMINKQFISQNPYFHAAGICANGKEVLNFIDNNTVDLIILDIAMPVMDGMELLKILRARGYDCDVIMATAAVDADAFKEALRLGVIDYMIKPYAKARFDCALRRFLNIKNAFGNISALTQQSADYIIDGVKRNNIQPRPKGIQKKTLETIRACMQNYAQDGCTSEQIAEVSGLSRVTVRRYIGYLEENGEVYGYVNYGTGGRPGMIYKNTLEKR